MQRHATDPGVFIRSMGTRGDLGGLAHATFDAMAVMDAMGYEVVVVETVGVGQDEVDIARLAHTTVVLSVPGLGDEVQAIKAGVLETGDLFVINKADRPETPALRRQLELMLHLRSMTAANGSWPPQLLETIAHTGQGVEALWASIAQHRQAITAAGSLAQRLGERCEDVFLQTLREEVARETVRMVQQLPGYPISAAAVRTRQCDPYSAAHALLDEYRRSRRSGFDKGAD
jgi:LAO/AO transport system kinase